MLKVKCVSIEASLKCTKVSGTTTLIKSTNTAKVDGIELATTANTDIEPFENPCDSGCFGGGDKCSPDLSTWKFVGVNKKINNKALLVEKSINQCTTKEGYITIQDVKQDIVIIDLSSIVLAGIEELNRMIDLRLDQYENDRDAFDTCFEHWFGVGHDESSVKKIVERMEKVQKWTAKVINNDGSLDDSYFILDNKHKYYNTYAHVYRTGKEIYLNPVYFSERTDVIVYDSHGGIIAHEVSHFKDFGDTDDHEYGKANCVDLATTDKKKALNNADSFEYFLESGENCP